MPIGEELQKFIRDIPDFPKPGILFKDITPLLKDPSALRKAVEALADHYRDAALTHVAAAEARGFIFAAPLALELGIGFVPIRKPGKLPAETRRVEYALEYGTDAVEIHADAVGPGDRVLVLDDLLATGGTVKACCQLVADTGATVTGCGFVIELAFLNGRDQLGEHDVFSLIRYD